MERSEIVKRFFEKGKLLTQDALDFLENRDVSLFLEKDYSDLVLSQRNFLFENIRVLKNLTEKKVATSKEDVLKFYTSKYEKMRNVITSRINKNFLSLNKLTSFREEVFLIGIVKDIKEDEKKIIELEDPTATVRISFDSHVDCDLDDVVAVQAIAAGKILYGKKILYPDIPLRSPTKGFGKACFVSDLHLEQSPPNEIEKFFRWFDMQEIDYLFIAGDTGGDFESLCNKTTFLIPGNIDTDEEYPYLPKKTSRDNIISLSNPSMVFLNGLKILMIHDFDLDMLRKRYLGKSNMILQEDYLVLDDIPDIVHYGHTHKPFISNYKSVTLVNSGSILERFMPVVVDFSTRECIQVNL